MNMWNKWKICDCVCYVQHILNAIVLVLQGVDWWCFITWLLSEIKVKVLNVMVWHSDSDTKGNCSIPISNNIGSKEHKMFINAQWCWYLTIESIFDTFTANYILSIDFSVKSFVSTFRRHCFPNELPSFYKSEGKLLRKERKLLRSLVKSSITAVLSVNNLCLFISNWNYLNNNNPFRNPYNLIFDKIRFQELQEISCKIFFITFQ